MDNYREKIFTMIVWAGVLFSAPCGASDSHPIMRAFGDSCKPPELQSFLSTSIGQRVQGGVVYVANAHVMRELGATLMAVGLPVDEIQELLGLLLGAKGHGVLRGDSVFTQAVEAWAHDPLGVKLIICAMSRDCQFRKNDADTHAKLVMTPANHAHPAILYVKSTTIQPSAETPVVGNVGTDILGGHVVRPLGVVHQFFHELIHYIDGELLLAWVLANQRLVVQGRVPGKLYSDYSRVGQGVTSISREFDAFFSEIRAYYINALLVKSQMLQAGYRLSREERRRIDNFFSINAIKNIETEGGGPILKAFGVTVENLFSFRDTFVDQMKKDIAAADAL